MHSDYLLVGMHHSTKEARQICAERINELLETKDRRIFELEAELSRTLLAEKRLVTLLDLTDSQDSRGRWQIKLDYDNVHDGARILSAGGYIIADCYCMEKNPNEQFFAAIDKIIKKQEKQ